MKLAGIQKSDKLILKGISRKGKQRIAQHGKSWIVLDRVKAGHAGNLLIRNTKKTFKDAPNKWSHDIRWIWIVNDMNFKIEKVIKK